MATPIETPADVVTEPRRARAGGASSGPRPTDRLVARLRVSDPPESFQKAAARAVREELLVDAAAWIPAAPDEPTVIDGRLDGVRPDALIRLLPESREDSARISNRLQDPALPGVTRAIVVASERPEAAGWLAALNPSDGRSFSPADLEPLQGVAALVAAQRANARLFGDLKDLLFGVIRSLTAAIDAKDPYTSGHSERVARIAVRIGESLGVSLERRGELYLMGLLHDVGKIGVDDVVLKKAGPLTPEETLKIRSHVEIGVRILSDLKKLGHLMPGVEHHHESLDGSGYPAGLAGERIPLPARILAVADAYDAMSSDRPYRRRLTTAEIATELRRGAGKRWDPRVVDALFACLADVERIRQKGLGESLLRAVDDQIDRG